MAGTVEVKIAECKAVWRLDAAAVSQVQHPNCLMGGPFHFLDHLVEVHFYPHGDPRYTAEQFKGHSSLTLFSDQPFKLTLHSNETRLWSGTLQDKQRVHESLRPASSRTKFGLVSASFPSSAFEGGKLVEFTVCFHGIPGASISLQDQALQFLGRQLDSTKKEYAVLQDQKNDQTSELRRSTQEAEQLRAQLESSKQENLQLRALLGEGGAGPVDAGQLARWHREMDRSTMATTPYDVVLAFNSLAKFLKTRRIRLLKNAESKLDIMKSESVRIIAIVGLFEKGKTWLINKLFGVNLPSGTLHETDGLSFLWIPERRMLLIDSAGVQCPVSYCAPSGAGSEESVDDALFDAKSSESFLFEMISRVASHMVFVVTSFTSMEQQYVEMLRRKYVARGVHKELIVVHNMLNVSNPDVAQQVFEKQVTTCYVGDMSTLGRLIFTAKKGKGPPVHHIGLCYEWSRAGDEFNEKNRQYLLQSLEHRELETEVVLQDQLREHLSELLKMFVSTELPEKADGPEPSFSVEFCSEDKAVFSPGDEALLAEDAARRLGHEGKVRVKQVRDDEPGVYIGFQGGEEEKEAWVRSDELLPVEGGPEVEMIPAGYVCGGTFTLKVEAGADLKMKTRGVISPLGELIGHNTTFEPHVNVYNETSEKGEVYRKIRIECPGVAEEDIELDDESLSAGFLLTITKKAGIDEQAKNIESVGGSFRQQQGRWQREFVLEKTDGKFEDPTYKLQDGILEITMRKKQKKCKARQGYGGRTEPAPSEAPSEASWSKVSLQDQEQ